mgnify:CR=1 FL=1
MKQRGFTLIELLVVVAIIGILAAVGVVAYNGYTKSAKASATKANFNLVRNFVVNETMKCVLGESYIMEKTIDCSKAIYNDANSIRHPIINFFENKIKNPYTGGKGVAVNSGVPDNDNEIGEVHISPHSSPERLRFMICFKSPCTNANNRIDETIYLPS